LQESGTVEQPMFYANIMRCKTLCVKTRGTEPKLRSKFRAEAGATAIWEVTPARDPS